MSGVFILSDVRLYRESLARYLADSLDISVAGAGNGSDDSLARADRTGADAVLVDMTMPEALEICRRLAETGARVVAIGVPQDEETILACAAIGLQGYVCRAASLADLSKALQNCGREEPWCDDQVSSFVMQCMRGISARLDRSARQDAPLAAAQLTQREMQVAQLMSEGLPNKEIAGRLSVEVCTIKNHIHSILSKLGARNRIEASHMLTRPLTDREINTVRHQRPWDI